MAADSLREKARAFSRRDAWKAGRLFFEGEAGRDPDSATAHACLGFFCLKETRYDVKRALAELFQALRLDPDCALAHVYLAIASACLRDAGASRKAVDAARRCGARPEDLVMAEAYVELDTGSLSAAIESFRSLVELERDSTSMILLSQALSQSGENGEALDWALKACAADPEDFRAPAYAGVYLAYLGRFEEARRELAKSAAMGTDYPLLHHTLAFVAREEGETAAAERHLRAALAVDPDYAASRTRLADLCAASGRRAEAKEHYRRALELFPDYPEARKALDALDI
ncbi:MAG: hypothetical protein A2V88_03285 [Elusimicrobia bacterium RBG_16_66_12]|nr:MAG: hypothetical protein A2V88_03285 [Elusimicrobia bacterium RBG_16_66_12]